jgi:hypothetical protein
MIPNLFRYQGLAVDDYGFALDASNLRQPRKSLKLGFNMPTMQISPLEYSRLFYRKVKIFSH